MSHVSCLILDAQQCLLYGTTTHGGQYGDGVLFRVNPYNGNDTVLLNFNGLDGDYPPTNLNLINHAIWGVTNFGGTKNDGVFYSYNLITNAETSIINFDDSIGVEPATPPVMSKQGIFYGTTGYGGKNNIGVIYKYDTTAKKDSVVINFSNTTGGGVYGGFYILNDTEYIGMTMQDGLYNSGTIYSFNPVTEQVRVLHNFNGATEGSVAEGNLIKYSNGLLYGVTSSGGNDNGGSLFSFDPLTQRVNILISFDTSLGEISFGNLLLATKGLLYGMTSSGGLYNDGVLFSYDINLSQYNVLVNFNGSNGIFGIWGLVEDTINSVLYGMTRYGGVYGEGVLFSYNLITQTDSILLNFDNNNGATPVGTLLLVYGAPKPVAQIQHYKDTICPGSCLCFADNSTNAPTSWRWFFAGTSTDSSLAQNPCNICYTAPGKYRVMLIAGNAGGSDTTFDSVQVIAPAAGVCCNESIISGQSAQLIADGGSYYTWSPPGSLSCDTCPNPVASPQRSTVYTVTISTDKGCVINESVTVDVTCEVFIPDAFSPGFGSAQPPKSIPPNSILYVRSDCIATMDFMVFDRWGNKVFESQNLNQGWDGTFKGQAMNTGTYMYYLKATLLDGTNIQKKGNVALVR